MTYRIAVGPNEGRKAFALQTMPAWGNDGDGHSDLATAGGLSLHAGVAARANERDKIERLFRGFCMESTQGPICYPPRAPSAARHVRRFYPG